MHGARVRLVLAPSGNAGVIRNVVRLSTAVRPGVVTATEVSALEAGARDLKLGSDVRLGWPPPRRSAPGTGAAVRGGGIGVDHIL
jgi:2-keto-3-deoxy-6-phosphogluconate aldolase